MEGIGMKKFRVIVGSHFLGKGKGFVRKGGIFESERNLHLSFPNKIELVELDPEDPKVEAIEVEPDLDDPNVQEGHHEEEFNPDTSDILTVPVDGEEGYYLLAKSVGGKKPKKWYVVDSRTEKKISTKKVEDHEQARKLIEEYRG